MQLLKQRATETFLMKFAVILDISYRRFRKCQFLGNGHLGFHADLREDAAMRLLAAEAIQPVNCSIREHGVSSSRRMFAFRGGMPILLLHIAGRPGSSEVTM